MATLALLQASIVAVSSDSFSGLTGKPPENKTNILRPGTLRRFFAKLRIASSMVRAPKSASALLNEDNPIPTEGKPGYAPGLFAATMVASGGCALGSTLEVLIPDTAAESN
jgi:hypothetical protein